MPSGKTMTAVMKMMPSIKPQIFAILTVTPPTVNWLSRRKISSRNRLDEPIIGPQSVPIPPIIVINSGLANLQLAA